MCYVQITERALAKSALAVTKSADYITVVKEGK